jgi:RimJ/RimL family protein N-acetyltransferase
VPSTEERKMIIRKPKWSDLDDLLDFINSLVEEQAPILRANEVSRVEEAEWLSRRLLSIEKGDIIHLVAETASQVVAAADIRKHKGRMCHVGTFGVASKLVLARAHTKLVDTLLQEAKRDGLKLIVLDVFEDNLPARVLYTKFGFKEVGKIPNAIFWNGRYMNAFIMALEID